MNTGRPFFMVSVFFYCHVSTGKIIYTKCRKKRKISEMQTVIKSLDLGNLGRSWKLGNTVIGKFRKEISFRKGRFGAKIGREWEI